MAITISGENNNDKILASDGVIDQISGINIVGVITATSFTGDLTGNVTGNLTGNVNSTSPLLLQTGGSERFRITGNNELGIAGANYGSAGQVLTSGGSGSAVTWSAIPTQVTISGNADNRVITGGSGTNLNGEANLSFNGTNVKIGSGTPAIAVGSGLEIDSGGPATVRLEDSGSTSSFEIQNTGGVIKQNMYNSQPWTVVYNSSEKFRITSAGKIGINTDNPNGQFHIHNSTAGSVTAATDANDLVIEASTNVGMSLLTANNSLARIKFGDPDATNAGSLVYNHQNDKLSIVTATGNRMIIGADMISARTDYAITRTAGGYTFRDTNEGNERAGMHSDASNNLIFKTAAASEKLRIDANGRLIVGHDAALNKFHGPYGVNNRNPQIQINGTNISNASLSITSWDNNVVAYYGAGIFLARSGSSTKGTNSRVTNQNTILGSIIFSGDDGTDFVKGAMIQGAVDNAGGAQTGDNDMPGRLMFLTTPDGAQEPTERLRLTSAGDLLVNSGATGGNTFHSSSYGGSLQVHDASLILSKTGTGTRNWRFVNNNVAAGNLGIQCSTSDNGGTSYGNVIEITKTKRVGIVQTTPLASLHVGTESGNNVAFQVGTISGQNRYLTMNHFGGQQNFYQLKMRVNDNGMIAMLDMGNPYGSSGHGTKIKFSGYQDNECGAIELLNTANNSASSADMVFKAGGTDERLRIHSNGILSTSNVADSVFKFQIDDSIGWWNTNTGLAPNSTRTWTITNVNYGGCKILIGGGDGNYQRAGAIIDVVGTMWANNKSYYHYETIKSSSGASISTTYNNSSIVISVTAGSNWWYYSMSIESHRRSSGAAFPTVSVS